MSQLPVGWSWVTLNDLQADEPRAITDGPFGSNLTSAHYSTSGARVIRLQNVGDGRFIDAEAFIPLDHFTKLKTHEARAGDLIIASLGEVLPRACLVPEHVGSAIVKADCIRVRLGDHVDPRWALYAMQTPQVRGWAQAQLHGVGRPRLGLKVIRQIPVPLPPIEEQRRIVDVLEGHVSRLDAAGRLVTGSMARLGRLRQATLEGAIAAARRDPDTRVATIGELARVGSGATPLKSRRDYYDGGRVPWVTSGDLSQSVILTPSQFITDLACSETAVKLWPVGTLLVAMYGEGKTRGTTSELAISATTNQACAAIDVSPEHHDLRPWLKLVLEANYLSLRRLAAGGVQPNLNLGLIKSMEVPVPSPTVTEGLLIHEALHRDVALRLREELMRLERRSELLRKSLLSASFTGRLTGKLSDVDRIEELAGV